MFTTAMLLLALLAPDIRSIPILRQSREVWETTKRENGLPSDSVGWWNERRGVIVILAPHPEEASTIDHERAHAFFSVVMTEEQREEWRSAWRGWGSRMPWGPARRRPEEAWAYLWEALGDASPYRVNVPAEAVALQLRLRRNADVQ